MEHPKVFAPASGRHAASAPASGRRSRPRMPRGLRSNLGTPRSPRSALRTPRSLRSRRWTPHSARSGPSTPSSPSSGLRTARSLHSRPRTPRNPHSGLRTPRSLCSEHPRSEQRHALAASARPNPPGLFAVRSLVDRYNVCTSLARILQPLLQQAPSSSSAGRPGHVLRRALPHRTQFTQLDFSSLNPVPSPPGGPLSIGLAMPLPVPSSPCRPSRRPRFMITTATLRYSFVKRPTP